MARLPLPLAFLLLLSLAFTALASEPEENKHQKTAEDSKKDLKENMKPKLGSIVEEGKSGEAHSLDNEGLPPSKRRKGRGHKSMKQTAPWWQKPSFISAAVFLGGTAGTMAFYHGIWQHLLSTTGSSYMDHDHDFFKHVFVTTDRSIIASTGRDWMGPFLMLCIIAIIVISLIGGCFFIYQVVMKKQSIKKDDVEQGLKDAGKGDTGTSASGIALDGTKPSPSSTISFAVRKSGNTIDSAATLKSTISLPSSQQKSIFSAPSTETTKTRSTNSASAGSRKSVERFKYLKKRRSVSSQSASQTETPVKCSKQSSSLPNYMAAKYKTGGGRKKSKSLSDSKVVLR